MAHKVRGAPHVQDGDPAQFPDRFAVWLKESNDIAIEAYNRTTMNGTVDQVHKGGRGFESQSQSVTGSLCFARAFGTRGLLFRQETD
jgi:hypothetical protein